MLCIQRFEFLDKLFFVLEERLALKIANSIILYLAGFGIIKANLRLSVAIALFSTLASGINDNRSLDFLKPCSQLIQQVSYCDRVYKVGFVVVILLCEESENRSQILRIDVAHIRRTYQIKDFFSESVNRCVSIINKSLHILVLLLNKGDQSILGISGLIFPCLFEFKSAQIAGISRVNSVCNKLIKLFNEVIHFVSIVDFNSTIFARNTLFIFNVICDIHKKTISADLISSLSGLSIKQANILLTRIYAMRQNNAALLALVFFALLILNLLINLSPSGRKGILCCSQSAVTQYVVGWVNRSGCSAGTEHGLLTLLEALEQIIFFGIQIVMHRSIQLHIHKSCHNLFVMINLSEHRTAFRNIINKESVIVYRLPIRLSILAVKEIVNLNRKERNHTLCFNLGNGIQLADCSVGICIQTLNFSIICANVLNSVDKDIGKHKNTSECHCTFSL